MESENKKPIKKPLIGRIVAIDKEGNEHEVMTGEMKAADYEPVLTGGDRIPTELESSAECTLEIKTVSRKRFIKLLMSFKDVDRNMANKIAKYFHKKYGFYAPSYITLLRFFVG